MSDPEEVELEAQLLPGERLEERIDAIKNVIDDVLGQSEVKEQFGPCSNPFVIKADEDFIEEGVAIGITIWFVNKIAGKIFDEYIWPQLKSRIDGLWRKN